ncbi:sulfate ABC transporter permease subunit CysW, partial [Ectothiorhodospira shaposhnikovii]|nr:sulfate ABC transporter permease subunit CysW [Ectothiorhodospira shaposhnikovii]
MTRVLLIGAAVVLTAIMVVVPLVYIFVQALSAGWGAYVANILDP